jgi:hypothetical protein
MSLLYRHHDGDWVPALSGDYRDERDLHDLLADDPSILPNDDLDDDDTLLFAVGYETALGSGYADVIFCSTGGKITICEVKLRRNAEIRREVIAQALSYAAFLEGMDVEAFTEQVVNPYLQFRGRTELLGQPLPRIAAALAGSEVDDDEFLSTLESALAEGSFRILIAVDEVHPQLRKSVAYIHNHAAFDLFVVEIAVFRSEDGEHEVLQPRLLDYSPAVTRRSGGTRFDRTPEDFLREAVERDPEAEDEIRQLFNGLVDMQRTGVIQLESGKGAKASLKVQVGGTSKSIVWVWADGGVTFPRYPLPSLGVPEDAIEAWIERIASASGASPSKWAETRQEPLVIEHGALREPDVVDVLLSVVADAASVAQHAAPSPS